MKMFLTLAAVAAAFATSSLAQAHDRAGGHWEWQSRPTPGPNKSSVTSQVRVWIKDSTSAMADCTCAMMKMSAADCMADMPGKRAVPSAGYGDCLADNEKQAGQARSAGEVFSRFVGARLPQATFVSDRALPIRRAPCE